jgi:putative transposase
MLRLLEPVLGVSRGCDLAGISRATLYRRRHPRPPGGMPAEQRPAPRNKLTLAECDELAAVLDSTRFADKAPRQVWAALIDEGVYLASVSTMYRLLRDRGEVRERRAQARHPARKKPELIATAPNQVWSWDITKLAGPGRGAYYHLYVMIDIFSRCAVHWEVHATELGELAEKFMEEAFRVNGGIIPGYVHSDRGTSMTSKPVTALLSDLGIIKSHSRPRVSNDNPYSESQFKTLKYCPVFPGEFGSLQDARVFCRKFFAYYNHEHHHSGIGLHTPYSVHIGTAAAVQEKRQAVLSAACAANPGRFTRHPRPPALPEAAWINEPAIETSQQDQPQEAA